MHGDFLDYFNRVLQGKDPKWKDEALKAKDDVIQTKNDYIETLKEKFPSK